MTMSINANDLVLKPIKGLRGKRPHNLPKGELRAYIWLDDGCYGSDYSHPTVSLRVHNENAAYGPDDCELIDIHFQRNMMGASQYDKPARGFMVGSKSRNGKWSTAYAAKISGHFNYNGRHLQAGIDLLARAHDATQYGTDDKLAKALGRAHCDLLRLIAGFQRIGVTVVIRDGKAKPAPKRENPTHFIVENEIQLS